MPDKPIHVQVAEALGWTDCTLSGYVHWRGEHFEDRRTWQGINPHVAERTTIQSSVPRYDTDWAATGPLIEEYRLTVRPTMQFPRDSDDAASWDAFVYVDDFHTIGRFVVGVTPLLAVCNLILELGKAGKLKRP